MGGIEFLRVALTKPFFKGAVIFTDFASSKILAAIGDISKGNLGKPVHLHQKPQRALGRFQAQVNRVMEDLWRFLGARKWREMKICVVGNGMTAEAVRRYLATAGAQLFTLPQQARVRGDLKAMWRFQFHWPISDWEAVAGSRVLYVLENEAFDDRAVLDLCRLYLLRNLRSAAPPPWIAAAGYGVSRGLQILDCFGFQAIEIPEDIPCLLAAPSLDLTATYKFHATTYLAAIEPLAHLVKNGTLFSEENRANNERLVATVFSQLGQDFNALSCSAAHELCRQSTEFHNSTSVTCPDLIERWRILWRECVQSREAVLEELIGSL